MPEGLEELGREEAGFNELCFELLFGFEEEEANSELLDCVSLVGDEFDFDERLSAEVGFGKLAPDEVLMTLCPPSGPVTTTRVLLELGSVALDSANCDVAGLEEDASEEV